MSIMNSFINDVFEKISTEAKARQIQQKTNSLIQRSPDCRQTHPPRRTRQARRCRRNQGCHQVLLPLNIVIFVNYLKDASFLHHFIN